MQVVAKVRNTGVSDKKLFRLAQLIRGREAQEALNLLRFQPSPHARILAKVVKSAMANAENNFQLNASELRLTRVLVDRGPVRKRYRPQARGRVGVIHKRSSHVTVVVEGEE